MGVTQLSALGTCREDAGSASPRPAERAVTGERPLEGTAGTLWVTGPAAAGRRAGPRSAPTTAPPCPRRPGPGGYGKPGPLPNATPSSRSPGLLVSPRRASEMPVGEETLVLVA